MSMTLEMESNDLALLVRQMERGQLVLFAGAGFSCGAKSGFNKEPLLANDLARILAEECGQSLQDESLADVYAFAETRLGTQRLHSILKTYYKDCTPASWHYLVCRIFWRRIYTTNIDDVLECAYQRSEETQRLDTIICPATYREPDLFYAELQCVHLHGSVEDLDKRPTFSAEDFGRQTAKPNPWYQALVDDMQSCSVVFVGTQLADPPFHHYLEHRALRGSSERDSRATAFLVAPKISPIRKQQLKNQKIIPIESTAQDFFAVLAQKAVPDRYTLLQQKYPHELRDLAEHQFMTQESLLREFEFVTVGPPTSDKQALRTQFFEGAEPTWDDIRSDVDAPRSCTPEFLKAIQSGKDGIQTILITGHAGSGKSCLMRRLAFEMAREGMTVYFLKSVSRFRIEPVIEFLTQMQKKRVFFFIDDAVFQLPSIERMVGHFPKEATVTFILADRAHSILPHLRRLEGLNIRDMAMPWLERNDSESIIKQLDRFGRLGALKGKPLKDQIREFLIRSKKQLLVAMKEATLGRGFDWILTNEFQTLSNDQARLAYTITCLAYMHGVPISRRHLLACLDGGDLERSRLLAEHLKEVVVPWGGGGDLVCPRHRVIARQVALETAPSAMRQEAVLRILRQLAPDIVPETIRRRSPQYRAYKAIVNFDNLGELMGENYDMIEETYSALEPSYANDFLFKLQFGRAEVHFDNFDRAENYLNQSLAIRPVNNFQTYHYLGVLSLKKARVDTNPTVAAENAVRGEELLHQQIRERGGFDAYPYAALVTHKLYYLQARQPRGFADQLSALVQLAREGLNKHPLDASMKKAREEVERAYLMQTIKKRSQGN
jgi:hypothetical protein